MTEFIKEILKQVGHCIDTETFVDVENTLIELKELASGNEWNSLKQTICSYLNTNGGYIICGVRERDKKYSFTSFNRNNESRLIDLQNEIFKNDEDGFPDLSKNIVFDYIDFKNGEVVVISVTALNDDLKFLKFNGEYYERKLTGDYKIPLSKINQQKEYKSEMEYAKELKYVENTGIKDLNLDKINHYITLLNQISRMETLKPSIAKVKPFLENRHFIKSDKVTTLGMLVCGDDPFHFLEYRAEVDCYFDTKGSILKDKKIFQDDVLSLMDMSFRFIWSHINTGKVVQYGGKTIPEYPEDLVAEMINNSLAHRDYTINNFVTINIEPSQYLQIKNPGSFKERLKIKNSEYDILVRRIIPGIPESKNPKLASVLKVFNKIENQGRGMASLVNAALENKIDLPFYDLKDNATVSLTIPCGKLLDQESEYWLNSFEMYINSKLKNIISNEQKIILSYFRKSEILNKRGLYPILLSESNNHFEVIDVLKIAGLIYEHPVSSDIILVYVLDRELMKQSFNDEIIALIGNEFIDYEIASKHVLNILYRYTKYNKQSLKPAVITPEVYFLEYGKTINPRKYETLGRKIRGICKKLNETNILLRDDKGAYLINFDYSYQGI